MATFRFIGSTAHLHVQGKIVDLTYFGQKVELSEDDYALFFANRVALLPQSEFAAFGITESELDQFATAAEMASAPASFLKKVDAARAKFSALMSVPAAPAPTEPVSNDVVMPEQNTTEVAPEHAGN